MLPTVRRTAAAGIALLVASGGLLAVGVATAQAATYAYSGSVGPGSATWERPLACIDDPPRGARTWVSVESFTVSAPGEYVLTAAATGGPSADTYLHLFEGSLDLADPLATCIGSNDDDLEAETLDSRLAIDLEADTTYLVAVSPYETDEPLEMTFAGTISGPGDIAFGAAPTVTVEQATTQADPTSVLPVEFEVAFSTFVTGLEPSDVILSGTAESTTVELVALDAPPSPSPSPSASPEPSPSETLPSEPSPTVTSAPPTITVSPEPSPSSAPPTITISPEPSEPSVSPSASVSAPPSAPPSEPSSSPIPTVTIEPDPSPSSASPSVQPTTEAPSSAPPSSGTPVPVGAGVTAVDEPAAIGEPLPDPDAYASRYLVRVLDAAQGGTITVAIAAGATTSQGGVLSLASTSADATVTYLDDAVAPSASATPTAAAPTTPAATGGEALAQTGSQTLWIALAAGLMLVAAGLLARASRATRTTSD